MQAKTDKDRIDLAKYIQENYKNFICDHQNILSCHFLDEILNNSLALKFLILNSLEIIILIPDNPRIIDLVINSDEPKACILKRVLHIPKKVKEQQGLKKGFLNK